MNSFITNILTFSYLDYKHLSLREILTYYNRIACISARTVSATASSASFRVSSITIFPVPSPSVFDAKIFFPHCCFLLVFLLSLFCSLQSLRGKKQVLPTWSSGTFKNWVYYEIGAISFIGTTTQHFQRTLSVWRAGRHFSPLTEIFFSSVKGME